MQPLFFLLCHRRKQNGIEQDTGWGKGGGHGVNKDNAGKKLGGYSMSPDIHKETSRQQCRIVLNKECAAITRRMKNNQTALKDNSLLWEWTFQLSTNRMQQMLTERQYGFHTFHTTGVSVLFRCSHVRTKFAIAMERTRKPTSVTRSGHNSSAIGALCRLDSCYLWLLGKTDCEIQFGALEYPL